MKVLPVQFVLTVATVLFLYVKDPPFTLQCNLDQAPLLVKMKQTEKMSKGADRIVT